MATNFPPSGSAATQSIWKPAGTVNVACSSSAVSGESLGGLAGSGAPTKGAPAKTWRQGSRRIVSETREQARKNSLLIRLFLAHLAGGIIPPPISLRLEFANFDVPEPALVVVISEEDVAFDFLAEAR